MAAAQIHKNNLNPTKLTFSPHQTSSTAYFKRLSIENLAQTPKQLLAFLQS
jgi:hypothetical protein